MSIEQIELSENEASIMVTSESSSNFLATPAIHFDNRRNTTATCDEVKDLVVHVPRQNNTLAIHRPSVIMAQRRLIMDLFSSHHGSNCSLNAPVNVLRENHIAHVQMMKNRRLGK